MSIQNIAYFELGSAKNLKPWTEPEEGFRGVRGIVFESLDFR